ncbi:PaaI family thioesterase [Bradymonadaceae bacterium TMQ3]|uniref:PaaI family thioesterase n=2 Tax=Lujinxingia sediminis TaxID=2480984 RepID=A0ABY0CVW9_9DELT|nr:PaaI family thioesterase [Bradymonadaceae bacterium TMQ3]RVU48023.1 PaaI family thioesterase [Lujinxingia sediminis]TXC77322.1 PaaI family thioesterase [Bradymonadales bacterium TMQ1]
MWRRCAPILRRAVMPEPEVLMRFASEEHSVASWRSMWPELRRGTALEVHGVELLAADDEGIELSMVMGPHALQPFGLLHGGISMLLGESAASMHACWKLDLTRRVPVGIEINGSHMRSATEGVILTRGRVLRKSRTLIHHEVEIVQAESGKTLSVIRVTNLFKSIA